MARINMMILTRMFFWYLYLYHNIATLCNIVNMICFYRRFFFTAQKSFYMIIILKFK